MPLVFALVRMLLRLLLRRSSPELGGTSEPWTRIHKHLLPTEPSALFVVSAHDPAELLRMVSDTLEGSALFPPGVRLSMEQGGVLGVVVGSTAPDGSGPGPWETFGRVLSSRGEVAALWLVSPQPDAPLASVYEDGKIRRQLRADRADCPAPLKQVLSGLPRSLPAAV